MRIDPDHYLEAGLERLTDAYLLHDAGRYWFAIYAAGRSVESILRAFATQKSTHLDAGHDLRLPFRNSGMAEVLPTETESRVAQAVNSVAVRWDNNLRFCGKRRITAHLRRRGLMVGVRGDPLKYNSSEAYLAAVIVVKAGERAWK